MTTTVIRREVQTGPAIAILQVMRVIDYFFGIIYALTIFDFSLEALGANEGNPFKQALDSVTDPFLSPFMGLFTDPGTIMGGLILSYLVALLVIVLVHAAIRGFLALFLRF